MKSTAFKDFCNVWQIQMQLESRAMGPPEARGLREKGGATP